jgi:hypothetical protein
VAPDRHKDFDFRELIGRIRHERTTLQFGIGGVFVLALVPLLTGELVPSFVLSPLLRRV